MVQAGGMENYERGDVEQSVAEWTQHTNQIQNIKAFFIC